MTPTDTQHNDADEIATRPPRRFHVQLVNGDPWYPFSPLPSDVRLIHTRSLARINRFGGHTRRTVDTYVNAQHSVLVARRVMDLGGTDLEALAAWGHDAHEGVPPGDQMGPFLRAWSNPEACALLGLTPASFDGVAAVVQLAKMAYREAFGIASVFADPRGAALIRQADMEVLATERRDLMAPSDVEWGPLPAPLPERIAPWDPVRAWQELRGMFYSLGGDKIAMRGVCE